MNTPTPARRSSKAFLASGVHENIGRFQIAMQNALLVGIMNGLGEGLHPAGDAPKIDFRTRRLLDQSSEVLSFDVVHREIMLSGVLPDFVDGHNVRVLQIGGRLGFGKEPLHAGGARELSGEDHFDGNCPIEAALAGFVDRAHAAACDFLVQFIVAKEPQRGQRKDRARADNCGRRLGIR